MSEKAYKFRTLTSVDIFPMCKIMDKIGFKKFKDCFQSDEIKNLIGKGPDGIESVGLAIVIDIAGIVIENIPSCQDDIFEMLASVSNMKKKDIEKMELGTFTEMIFDFFHKPEFKDFFKVVSKLFK